MNELIRELADQARREASLYGGKPGDKDFDQRFQTFFATAVVKECLSYAKDGDLDFMKFMIDQRFGVRE